MQILNLEKRSKMANGVYGQIQTGLILTETGTITGKNLTACKSQTPVQVQTHLANKKVNKYWNFYKISKLIFLLQSIQEHKQFLLLTPTNPSLSKTNNYFLMQLIFHKTAYTVNQDKPAVLFTTLAKETV